jgi:RND family efflux transporter MFP subunit
MEGLIFIYVKEGQRVKKGARLFGNETRELDLKFKLATLQWKQAKFTLEKIVTPLTKDQLEYEELAFKQKSALYKAGGLSDDAFQVAKLEHQLKTKKGRSEDITISELDVATKRVQLQMAQEALSKATFKAPLSGKINKVYVQHNEWVKPGQKILQLIGSHPLYAMVNAGLSRINNISYGEKVDITVNRGDSKVDTKGVIKFISEDVDAASQTVRVRIEINNADRRFKPGMRAEVILP